MRQRPAGKPPRGRIGWAALIAFWAWNVFMAVALVVGWRNASRKVAAIADPTAREAAEVVAGLGSMVVLVYWVIGATVLGLIAHFTRSK